MAFFRKPFLSPYGMVAAGLLAAVSGSVLAQGMTSNAALFFTATHFSTSPDADNQARHHGQHMGRHEPAEMQAFMAKRQSEFKTRLNVTPSQEEAWTVYTAAMQVTAHEGWRLSLEQSAEAAKLSTPQRIDNMRASRMKRMTEASATMDRRGDATKVLYAALSPDQQKVMDAQYQERQSRWELHHRNSSQKNPVEMPKG